jgi:GT2 family glycosyltransferase
MSSFSWESEKSALCGAVVIGRNEGDRLRGCLESVMPHVGDTVYVDSGSCDDSPALANRLGAHTIELSTDFPFTAARARNVGWKRILQLRPDVQYLQFVDGDCLLDPAWIGNALAEFAKHPEAGILFGHVRETWPKRNIYHRLAAMEWDTPVGRTKYCGGIAMIRASAIAKIGGYRDGLIAGEEPEMCVRLRQAGWSVVKLDREMASHDSNIGSFGLWWKRSVRSGRAFAEGASLHGGPPERHWVKETRSIWLWGIVIPILGLSLIWPTRGVSLAVMAAMYLALLAKITIVKLLTRKCSIADALLYAAFCVVGKWPQAIGLSRYYFGLSKRSPIPFS